LLAAHVHAIAVQAQGYRNERFERGEVLIVRAECAQRIDGCLQLEDLLVAGLRNGYASLLGIT